MFAVVVLAFHPHRSLLVENGTEPEGFPPEFFPAVADGVKSALGQQAIRVVLVDGIWHEVDSSPTSFRLAGHQAAAEALGKTLGASVDPRSARQISSEWMRERGVRLSQLTRYLTRKLESFRSEDGAWVRARQGVVDRVELVRNAPRVPTAVDLRLSFSSPALLRFLNVTGDEDDRLPYRIAPQKLSALAGRTFPLAEAGESALDQSLKEYGFPYFEEYGSPAGLLRAPGYLDSGTRSALLFLTGQRDEALKTSLDGLEKSFPNSRERKFCGRVLQALEEGS